LNDDGVRAAVGSPVAAEVSDFLVSYRDYERARLYWSLSYGVFAMSGNVKNEYVRLGEYRNPRLGVPVSNHLWAPDLVGTYVHLAADASIYDSPVGGTHAVYGRIRAKWAEGGWERSPLGYPVADELVISTGKKQEFQHGWIEWQSATDTTTTTPK
jgi:uncharacterized protein with LGFP repeats